MTQDALNSGETATEVLHNRLLELTRHLDIATDDRTRAQTLLELGHTRLELEMPAEAWQDGEQAFQLCAQTENWEGAVEACNVMFHAEQPGSLAALGHGLWLGVTFPINPELSVSMLQHLVDETPPDADGAAVAAATAHYIADLRAGDAQRDSLLFFTNQMLGQVARRHSQVESQEQFDFWISRLELDAPNQFLPRLAQIIDVLVQDNWWIDRDALRAKLPE